MTPTDPGNAMTENETPPPAPAGRRDLPLFEIVMGTAVLLISLVSLFVAVSANRTQERMLAASVWPSLTFATGNADADGTRQVSFDLLNRGIGPARVRWAELRYRNTAMHDTHELLAACCGPGSERLNATNSGVQGRVVGAGEWIKMLRVPPPDGDRTAYDTLSRERMNVRLRLCYCSVLDDCWVLDSTDEDPEPVKRCPAPPAVLWNG